MRDGNADVSLNAGTGAWYRAGWMASTAGLMGRRRRTGP